MGGTKRATYGITSGPEPVIVALHTDQAPTNEEWDVFLELLGTVRARQIPILPLTDGGGPTALQRVLFKSALRKLGDPAIRISIVCEGLKLRAIVAALRPWFDIASFKPSEYGLAVARCGTTPADEVWARALELQAELPQLRVMQEVERHRRR
jgi:hypothetical protein